MDTKFKGLSRELNACVVSIASRVLPNGFDVSADAPQTFEELKEHFAKTGRICVWNEASDLTIYADKEVNYSFRAWHDYHHLKGGFEFTKMGELDTVTMQCNDIQKYYGLNWKSLQFILAVFADGYGQVEYFEKYESFPVNQLAFVQAYLKNSVDALAKRW